MPPAAPQAPKPRENASSPRRNAASRADSLPPVYALGLGLPLADGTYALNAEQKLLLDRADVLVGGKRILDNFPAFTGKKLPVTGELAALYEQIAQNRAKGHTQVALCSGDPLFFGLGARLVEHFGTETVRVIPAISSLQAAAALLGISPENARAVSLHGRSDKRALARAPLARALLAGGPVFVLTDKDSAAQNIAAWMCERGCERYILHALESLFLTPEGEIRARHHARLTVPEAAATPPEQPTGPVILVLEPVESVPTRQASTRQAPPQTRSHSQPWPFGLDDEALAKQNRLLSKAPVRAVALAALGIEPQHVVWDLGGGSGAVGVEAARLAWQGMVYSVEQRPERVADIQENRKRYGAVNMEIIEARMPDCLPDCLNSSRPDCLPAPDRIFLGGGLGGSLDEAQAIVQRAYAALKPGGIMLADCVLLSSLERARNIFGSLGAAVDVTCLQASTGAPLAKDMRLIAHNPVFLVRAQKPLTGSGPQPHERTA